MVEKEFTRLFKVIDELCEEGVLDGKELTAQVGFDNYKSQYYKCFDMTADEGFKRLIDESDLIIAHACLLYTSNYHERSCGKAGQSAYLLCGY